MHEENQAYIKMRVKAQVKNNPVTGSAEGERQSRSSDSSSNGELEKKI